MTSNSDGKQRDHAPAPDPDRDRETVDENQDLHPAIDPREPPEAKDDSSHPEAPPLDVDDRDHSAGHPHSPDVIELSGHTDSYAQSPPEDVMTIDKGEVPTDADGDLTGVDPVQPRVGMDDENGTRSTLRHESWKAVDTGDDVPDSDSGSGVAGEEDTRSPDPATPPNASDTVDETLDSSSVPTDPEQHDPGASQEPAGEPSSEEPMAKASALFSGAASRLGLGKLLKTSEDSAGAAASVPPQSADSSGSPRTGIPGSLSRLGDGVRAYVDPRLHMFSTVPHRRLVAVSGILTLLCLVANSGGLALIVLSSSVPILILITLTQHDVFEKESNFLIAAVCAAGTAIGIIVSAIASWIHGSQWYNEGVLNFGAAGFGGRFADAAGPSPWIVWLLAGLIIPAVSIAAFAGVPIAMRRWPRFRNEVMDGVILTGASAAGLSIGASLVYWWPMIADSGPQANVSDWTLSILGVAFLRPIVVTLCGAMIGAGVWRYMIATNTSVIVLPAIGGVVGYLLLTFGSIQIQPSGAWPEFLWTLLVAVAVFVLYRRVLDQAVATDRLALGAPNARIVCSACHKVTPVGTFCASCGAALNGKTTIMRASDGNEPEAAPLSGDP